MNETFRSLISCEVSRGERPRAKTLEDAREREKPRPGPALLASSDVTAAKKATLPVKGHLELIHRRAFVSVEKLISALSLSLSLNAKVRARVYG